MQLEAGKYYRNRKGEKVGPMVRFKNRTYPWLCDGLYYADGGEYNLGYGDSELDLIAEWTDETSAIHWTQLLSEMQALVEKHGWTIGDCASINEDCMDIEFKRVSE